MSFREMKWDHACAARLIVRRVDRRKDTSTLTRNQTVASIAENLRNTANVNGAAKVASTRTVADAPRKIRIGDSMWELYECLYKRKINNKVEVVAAIIPCGRSTLKPIPSIAFVEKKVEVRLPTGVILRFDTEDQAQAVWSAILLAYEIGLTQAMAEKAHPEKDWQ